jgi:hypothetical protein
MIHGERQMTTNPTTLTACEASDADARLPRSLTRQRAD